MNRQSQDHQGEEELGLLSKEAGSRWIVAIDEIPESQDWLLEIDSPRVYLTFQLAEIAVLGRAVDLLNSALVPPPPGSKYSFNPDQDDIGLGHFDKAAVHLVRDNEDFPRCFVVVGPEAGSVMRIS